jgi:hypothetical protein
VVSKLTSNCVHELDHLIEACIGMEIALASGYQYRSNDFLHDTHDRVDSFDFWFLAEYCRSS